MMAKYLTPQQIKFAEWLATVSTQRSPATQRELAVSFGVSERTLKFWKKIPAIWELVSKLNADKLMSLVTPAVALLEKAIEKPGSVNRVSFDAAKSIVQDWAKRRQGQDDIAQTIADLYKKYHPERDRGG